jgi:hypothetical protein
MHRRTLLLICFDALLWVLTPPLAAVPEPEDFLAGFQYQRGALPASLPAAIGSPGQFNGYTNYWHSIYWDRQQFGNLFQISLPQVDKTIAQTKVDIAEELGIPGLLMEEGFLEGLLNSSTTELDSPTMAEVEKQAGQSDLLLYVDSTTELGRRLARLIPADADWRKGLKSHQLGAADFQDAWAFALVKGERKLFVVMSASAGARSRLREQTAGVRDVTSKYDLHRGWFGTGTLLHSVTCFPGHPLEVIGQGLNQGNDWFTFSGYMDYMLLSQLPEWLGKVGLNIPTDVGTGKATHSFGTIAYGCRNWDGLKIQDTPTEEEWIKFVKDRGGHIFRPVFSAECDPYKYDGYIAIDGNKNQIDGEDVPFVLQTGFIREDAPAAMVLFAPKGQSWSREAMWAAIMERREVGVLPQGKMLGPKAFRNSLQMLLLDRAYLEDYFGDAVQIRAAVDGRTLRVRLGNVRETPVTGKLEVVTAPELELGGQPSLDVALPPGTDKELTFDVRPRLTAMGRTNPVLASFAWSGREKRTLAIMDMPPAISVDKLLYGQAPEVAYPVSVHNFGDQPSFPVRVRVSEKGLKARSVYEKSQNLEVPPGEYRATTFRLPLKPGAYVVRVEALGASAESQLGVGAAAGRPTVTTVDLNGDGLPEFRLENDKVRVTLLAIGARIIEYFVKERNDNVLFKLWPEKELTTDKRPFRERGFYPYGGFEDFLGQASIETHKVYDAEITRRDGASVQVRMWADYYGNRLEKTFTLYGNSPLVEVRYAIDFKNPELHMIGPQPILELGKKHWTEDAFFVPTVTGIREFHMRPEEYFGEVLSLKEGWNAGRDTVEDVCFVGAYPVSEPEFLHMWMNHPVNTESNHYYAEFQPWIPIFHKNVRYFTYYLWGAPGRWEDAVEALRQRNLITTR